MSRFSIKKFLKGFLPTATLGSLALLLIFGGKRKENLEDFSAMFENTPPGQEHTISPEDYQRALQLKWDAEIEEAARAGRPFAIRMQAYRDLYRAKEQEEYEKEYMERIFGYESSEKQK